MRLGMIRIDLGMMKTRMVRLVLAIALGMALAQGARAAESWGLANESIATFKAKVVDIQCELGGACAPDCGGGKRPLGLLMADGKLRVAIKGSSDFAGPVSDLQPYCGREIFVDGLLIESPKATLYFVQFLRESEAAPWTPADSFLKRWTQKNGTADEWVRADPAVKAIIAKDGVLGLGPDVKP
jgi:hypothetical protein